MNIWKVFKAVFSAFIGVQSEKNRLEDFQSNSPIPFILVGILMVLIFIVSLIYLVNFMVYLT
ncbi:MAG: DUF2970 domain-containing protein [Marinomonas sp.]|jgi:flagellar biogenesis protein FliO|uniref:DUF2970 domain-containing protein n=1 Tax=unclassified Marinomonas TaxID=196814 RepID=UPI0005F9DC31|nr:MULTISPECIES: DUF2970 domain-containing protein [unclassified Marinomonas]KJZ12733.1 membrane protein [Marinomonas sp. S3726]KZM38487.1 membrane protein [Marinomonas sp. SBI22]KZM38675.1 membrane protein [Marinomonas sp. SBI8L]